MRKTISWEDDERVPGIVLEFGALQWGEDRIPVTGPNYTNIDESIGFATDIRREEDGSITADVQSTKFLDENLASMSFTIYASDVVGTEESGLTIIHEARLRCIFLTEPAKIGW